MSSEPLTHNLAANATQSQHFVTTTLTPPPAASDHTDDKHMTRIPVYLAQLELKINSKAELEIS